jgi:hypothetical protein
LGKTLEYEILGVKLIACVRQSDVREFGSLALAPLVWLETVQAEHHEVVLLADDSQSLIWLWIFIELQWLLRYRSSKWLGNVLGCARVAILIDVICGNNHDMDMMTIR